MSGYRPHPPPQPLLFGYDPVRDLPADHLARLVEEVVQHSVRPPSKRTEKGGQPAYDPRLCLKVLIYGYCTGVTSTRRLEQNCRESLPYLFLTRGDAPSYRTLADERVKDHDNLVLAWEGLFAIAAEAGLSRLGKIVIDSTKIRADVSSASMVSRIEFDAVRAELERCLAEALAADAAEGETASPTQLEKETPRPEQMRDILPRVWQQRRQAVKTAEAPAAPLASPRPVEAGPEALTLPLEGLPPAETPSPATAEPLDPAQVPKPLRHLATAVLALHAATAASLSNVSLTDPDENDVRRPGAADEALSRLGNRRGQRPDRRRRDHPVRR